MLSKRITFRTILLIIPIVFLSLLELFLRVINYGGDQSIVATIERKGKMFYTMSQSAGKKYFNKDRYYYRKGSHDYFEIEKTPNTVRVFCFGASTTAGFPYEYNAIPSEFLRERLATSYPDKNIEVINTAIAATNSFTVVEFEKELVRYQPDLFVVYMGQNEFYGAYGVGSTISAGKNRWLIKTNLWLQHFRTYLLLENVINSVLGMTKSEKTNGDVTLMEEMIQNGSIAFNSSDYLTAREIFKENYDEVIKIAKENNIPIIISTLVTNEKDLPPFVSMNSKQISEAENKKCKELYNSGLEDENKNDYETAIRKFQNSILIDPTQANVHYELGKCFLALKDFDSAKKYFILAKDLDGLRFRAPSEYNIIIRQLPRQHNVLLADVESIFRKNSTNGIIGNDLLIDHVHPNVRGYFLMAKSWFQAIKENKLIKSNNKNFLDDDSLLWQNAPVTYLDSAIGELKIKLLKSKPPFQNENATTIDEPANFIERQAYLLTIQHQDSWGGGTLI